jgi:predicted nuclease of predicted toxin-antitoxin system
MPWKTIDLPSQKEIDAYVNQFKKKSRFLVDESLGPEAAVVIREQGWNAKYVDEVGLKGHVDEDVFAFAWKDDRILLTHDRDFLDDRAFPPHRNPGLVVLPGGDGDERALIKGLLFVLSVVAPFREGYRRTKIVINADDTWTIVMRDSETGAMQRTRMRTQKNGPIEEWEDV